MLKHDHQRRLAKSDRLFPRTKTFGVSRLIDLDVLYHQQKYQTDCLLAHKMRVVDILTRKHDKMSEIDVLNDILEIFLD
jgi:hypothetical protein